MITFRQTIRGDTPVLSEIFSTTLHYGDATFDGFRDHDAGWVACVDGKPVGVALADRAKGELLVVAVISQFAGKGLARELMRQAEMWLFSHGWSEIHLTVPDKSLPTSVGFLQHLGWNHWKPEGNCLLFKKKNSRSCIKLEEHAVDDPDTGFSRVVRLQRGPAGKSQRLCLILDGESYWRDMDAIPLLNELLDQAKLPPMTIALVGHVSGTARHEDYTCNEHYALFIGEVVMPWLKKEIPDLDEGGHIICGLSLSGLMSVYLTLQYPQYFSGCLSQSGSHWWSHEWFTQMAQSKRPITANFWLSVGDQETGVNVKHPPTGLLQEISQIEGVEKAARTLKEIGGIVYYHQYHGGHSLQCWRSELDLALQWLTTKRKPKAGSGNHCSTRGRVISRELAEDG